MLNKIASILTLLMLSSYGQDQAANKHSMKFMILSSKGNYEDVNINIQTGSFNPSKHKVEKNNNEYGFTVDGKIGYGYDGVDSINSNATEVIRKIEILWKGKNILIKPEHCRPTD